ncbi:hypothetical protein EU803_15655 [Loktanella sp. IMCC34160]|uniref:hypothetical protein n=1 Tax=Loktanella sp. IMCC34160 TaxID=2510646 RepID=UPI00101CF3DB|nr:hypothetical protein [Loktanella sp. IMCC34160]RYG90049.1 hypothetical protein EU803_15655 [Loktanella sp. IMCC34160]
MALGTIGNRLRLLAAMLRKGTVRFYTGSLVDFYQGLNSQGVPYVVLRWADQVPTDPTNERAYVDDIDHLVADDAIQSILQQASRHPGTVKCDYYSVSGQQGSSYRDMPYYMPALAEKLLTRRWLDERGFYRPHPTDEFLSFAYHLCYHKGIRCGLPDGLALVDAVVATKKDYASELRRLASSARWGQLPNPLTLLALHGILKDHGWNMPADLMVRWPDQHPFLVALQKHEQTRTQSLIADAKGLTLFILREDCDSVELEGIARQCIEERFEILSEIRLTATQQERVINQTRGGDWVEKYCSKVVAPTVAFICRDAAVPGPLPIRMSPKKLRKRYPHVTNTDVLIKRNIRASINRASPTSFDRVAIHATDNATEAVEMMQAIFGDSLAEELSKLASR